MALGLCQNTRRSYHCRSLGHYGLYTRLATQPVRARDRAPSGGAATVRGHTVTRTHCDPERNATTPLATHTTPGPTRWRGGSRALRGGLLREPGAVFPLVSHGLYVLAGRGAGLPGNPDGALPGRRSMGPGDSAGAGGRDTSAAAHVGSFYSDNFWHTRAVRLGPSRR